MTSDSAQRTIRHALTTLLSLTCLVSVVAAQDIKYRDGRFMETVGGVTLQRAEEASSEEAVLNMPFLPGDRVWTDDSGRAEIVFADGEILWIAERSKVDSLGRGGNDQDERLGLRVFAGSFGGRVHSGGPGFEFRAPGGNVTTTGASAFRVDIRAGETVVSVSEGEVLLNLAGKRLTLRSGERARYADGGVEGPFRYPRTSFDGFDQWCSERYEELSRLARDRYDDRLPDELAPYSGELSRNGEWVYEEPQGYVYVPRVAYDWAPYTYGRWVYTLYGWTWVADEPWGFVTSHYGRWGYSSRLGWHWMPRLGFSGAWVVWSSPVGVWSNTIGWCALGFNDRPVASLTRNGVGRSEALRGAPAWSFARRSDLGRGSVQRRRIDLPVDEAQRAVVWNLEAVPDREWREARRSPEGHGRTTNGARVYVRPSPGDSLPELRWDPATTIPSPEARRGRTIGQDGFKEEQDNRKSRSRPDHPSWSTGSSAASPRTESARPRPAERSGSPDPHASPTDESAGAMGRRERPARDPLLSLFFKSLTQPDLKERGSNRETNPNRSDDGSTRRREPAARDDSSARDSNRRETSRPAETRPPDAGRERARPAREAEPRTPPPPQASPRGGRQDERGEARKPHKDG